MQHRDATALTRTYSKAVRRGVSALIVAALGWLSVPSVTHAEQAPNNRRDFTRFGSFHMEGVSDWFDKRFSEAELARYGPENFAIEQYMCNCYDRPEPHFPYVLMFFYTPKGDLVGRPERRGFDTVIVPLAVRHGERYCEIDNEDVCYGTFADPCEFTDSRYGEELAKYFPYCK